jgi:hypothetical protein
MRICLHKFDVQADFFCWSLEKFTGNITFDEKFSGKPLFFFNNVWLIQ